MAKFINELVDIKMQGNRMVAEKNCTITSQQIFNTLKNVVYRGSGLQRDPKAESGGLPAIVPIFYKFVFDYCKIPTQDQLIRFYMLNYCENPNPDENNIIVFKPGYCLDSDRKYNYLGVCARLLRAYPSLIREFHLYLLCQESKKFKNVAYSLSKDFYDGLDLRIDTEKGTYYVSVFVNTARSIEHKKAKDLRHDYSHVKEIKLGVNLQDCDAAGNFLLCGQKHIDILLNEIAKYEQEVEKVCDIGGLN